MRVLSGKYRGKKLIGSEDNSIRPTTNKIKEYIFNILQDFVENKSVVDIFSGSGNLGIEALSRNANHAVFVDSSRQSLNVLKKNLADIKIPDADCELILEDAINFSKQTVQQFGLAFMDPPFNYPPLNDLIHSFFENRVLSENGILVVEHEISNPVNFENKLYEIIKQKKIGRSLISFIINKRSNGA